MELLFKLRPEFKGVSGLVQYGSSGETLNLAEDLNNKGEIRTEDPAIQVALLNLHGDQGRVFEACTADGEPYEDHLATVAAEMPSAAPGADVPAEHGEGSNYEGLTKEELLDEAGNRGLDVASNLKKAELIQALEANDAQGGTSSGSTDS